MKPDVFWIPGPWRGKLAIVSRPRGWDWVEDEAREWRQAGLDVVVSLLESEEAAQLGLAKERDAAEANCVSFVAFPIPDRGVPSSIPQTVTLLNDIARKLEEGKNVAVHCRQGVGRSGLIAAGVLVRAGINVDQAIDAVRAASSLWQKSENTAC